MNSIWYGGAEIFPREEKTRTGKIIKTFTVTSAISLFVYRSINSAKKAIDEYNRKITKPPKSPKLPKPKNAKKVEPGGAAATKNIANESDVNGEKGVSRNNDL